MKRSASAHWEGSLAKGHGLISTESTTLNKAQYSFSTRFENGVGTNPEELIAAAHAGCFTMATSAGLQKAGFTADSLDTTATLTMENLPEKSWTVTAIHLELVGKVPGIDAAKFAVVTAAAKAGCPISRLLNTTITLDAKLAG